MPYQIKNQTPVALTSDYSTLVQLKKPGDPVALLTANISEKLFTNKNTNISYDTLTLDPDKITNLLVNCVKENIDPKSEKLARELLSKTALNYTNQNMITIRLLYAQMAAEREKLPAPSTTIIYTIKNDVIPSFKNYLAQQGSSDAVLASLAYVFKPKVLAYAFENEQDFENFKTYFNNTYVQNLSAANKLSNDTMIKCRDFNQEKLSKLTINLRLRFDNNDEQEPYAFARLLVLALSTYANDQANRSFALPFDLGENYNPRSLILVNVDQHAHSTAHRIKQVWAEINKATQQPLRMVSNKHLSKLISVDRLKNQLSGQPDNGVAPLNKTKYVPLATKRPKPVVILKRILTVLNHMKDQNQSNNVYKVQKITYNKPNRRQPDNINLPGKLISTRYKPDLHIYLDTSGSITKDNYTAGIKLCIMLAKKLDIDLYFNSFSHYLSQSVKLPLKGHSLPAIYSYFELIPKVTGGTNYYNVWQYINRSAKRRKELSLLITDFEEYAPNTKFEHPKNLYYIPIDQSDFNEIHENAEDFLESMINAGHNIRKNILL